MIQSIVQFMADFVFYGMIISFLIAIYFAVTKNIAMAVFFFVIGVFLFNYPSPKKGNTSEESVQEPTQKRIIR